MKYRISKDFFVIYPGAQFKYYPKKIFVYNMCIYFIERSFKNSFPLKTANTQNNILFRM